MPICTIKTYRVRENIKNCGNTFSQNKFEERGNIADKAIKKP
nr:MAG TPA: hypothetical protein [Caudoviricetes sp.]